MEFWHKWRWNGVGWCQDGLLMTKHCRTTRYRCSSQICLSRWWRQSGACANSPADLTCWLAATCPPTSPRSTTSACRSFWAPTYSSSWGRRPASTTRTARPSSRRRARRRTDRRWRAEMAAAARTEICDQDLDYFNYVWLVTSSCVCGVDCRKPVNCVDDVHVVQVIRVHRLHNRRLLH